jgi:hypothetical protein
VTFVGTQTIRARCDDCAEVTILPGDLTVIRYPDDTGWYRFVCPCCGQPTQRYADSTVFDLVAGVDVAIVDVAPESGTGPLVSLDDLIDLHAELALM